MSKIFLAVLITLVKVTMVYAEEESADALRNALAFDVETQVGGICEKFSASTEYSLSKNECFEKISYSFKECSEANYSEYINEKVRKSDIKEENAQLVLAFAIYRLQVSACILKKAMEKLEAYKT